MASRVVMPKLSDTMEEGRILRWLRNEGDRVETGQPLAEVETDKATVEMEAYTTGVVRKLVAPEGATIKVGNLIAVIGTAEEDISTLLTEQVPVAAAPRAPSAQPVGRVPARAAALTQPLASGRTLRASPLALRMAAEAGLDLNTIAGSGPQGRVIKRDIEAALAAAAPAPPPSVLGTVQGPRPVAVLAPRDEAAEFQAVELSMMRRTIAKRLVQSKSPVPHFYLTVEVAMDRAWEAYQALREQPSEVTLNDIIVKATAAALRRHPQLNASFGGDHVRQYTRVHIGMAVAVEDGLITPVIRDADSKSLEEIAADARVLIERARSRQLRPDEYTGATFSISNLGMMGIDEFSAIINPPEAAILAVGTVRQAPFVEHGQVKVGYRMKMTLSVDHRVADGATAASFMQTLKRMLENPLLMA
jgi:pyruvate dehydrogenase E2 component (dihydrolipoyllysine-residue acetyltransferase)